jgi:hypothetical protein
LAKSTGPRSSYFLSNACSSDVGSSSPPDSAVASVAGAFSATRYR